MKSYQKPYNQNKKEGFTLVELLVVIAIIGLLSSVVLASYTSIRKSAQNTHVISEVEAAEAALVLYHEDYGTYPSCTTNGNVNYETCCVGSGCIFDSQPIIGNMASAPVSNNKPNKINAGLASIGSLAAYMNQNLNVVKNGENPVWIGGQEFLGVSYKCYKNDQYASTTGCSGPVLSYGLNGDVNCVGGTMSVKGFSDGINTGCFTLLTDSPFINNPGY